MLRPTHIHSFIRFTPSPPTTHYRRLIMQRTEAQRGELVEPVMLDASMNISYSGSQLQPYQVPPFEATINEWGAKGFALSGLFTNVGASVTSTNVGTGGLDAHLEDFGVTVCSRFTSTARVLRPFVKSTVVTRTCMPMLTCYLALDTHYTPMTEARDFITRPIPASLCTPNTHNTYEVVHGLQHTHGEACVRPPGGLRVQDRGGYGNIHC